MTILLLMAIPFGAALLALATPNSLARWRRLLPPVAAALHLGLVVRIVLAGVVNEPWAADWIDLDPLGLLFTGITSILFFVVAIYLLGDLPRYAPDPDGTGRSGSERVYIACLLFFLFTMTAVCLASDMGIIWVAVEATTLATAPLIYFRRNQGSLEATWKYLLICSVGIALALLGTFLLAVAAGDAPGGEVTLNVNRLTAVVAGANPTWLKAAFIFIIIGYGAKMGLAPMHTWLPDAHSEAPSPVSALLSGALLNGAFLAILRTLTVMDAAGLGDFAGELLRLFGLLSMGVAGAFILGQNDFKRLLAYSSVEHMGILAFAAGLGGTGVWAALLHAVNHTFIKGCLFLAAGNIYFRYHTKSVLSVTGLRRAMPYSGTLWLVGFMAICGLPPFGLFFPEFATIRTAFGDGHVLEGILFLLFLAVVFIGMLKTFLAMLRGAAPASLDASHGEAGGENNTPKTDSGDPFHMALPSVVLMALTLACGLGLPDFLGRLLTASTRLVDPFFTALPGILP